MNRDLSEQQFGNYWLVRRLGGGGFADVYLGQHVRITTQQAAIKILHLTDVDESQFQQEAERTASLRHPHIVRVYDFDIQHGTPFLVLDYAPNGSLASKYKGQRLSPGTIILYLKQIAPALQYAHDNHLIHRDIKPDNILIGSQDELLVSDFGIAVIAKTGRTSIQSTYNIGGTPFYMAPEMFRGKPEKASDQYSLGIMVYSWLCGHPPFTEGDFIQLGFQHAAEPVPSLLEQVSTLSPQVEQVVMRALAKNAQDRFPSVQTFADALEAVYRGSVPPPDTVASRPVTIPAAMVPVHKLAIPPKGPILGTTLLKYTGHSGDVYAAAWSPDGSRLASGSADNTVQVWDASTGQHLVTYAGHSGHVSSVVWSPDGSRLASGSVDNTVQVWNVNTGLRLTNYRADGVSVVAWSAVARAQDRYLLGFSSGRTTQLWDASSGECLLTYRGHLGKVTSVAWSPDGQRIASSGLAEDSIQVWSANTGQHLLTCKGHLGKVSSVAWSPDGQRVASGSSNKTVQVWRASTGNLIYAYQGHSEPVLSAVWSPDGIQVASAAGREIHIWQAM